MQSKKLKFKENGITLIALVITIIVLLILAGVSIAMLTGQNGILTQAQNAKNTTEQASIKEENDLLKINDYITSSLDDIKVEQVIDENPGVLEQDSTDSNMYIINSIEDLVFFSYDVRNGNEYEGKTVKLGFDLDFNSTKSYVEPYRTDYSQYGYDGKLKECLANNGWISIGDTINIAANNFKGTFDGNNKNIYHLLINNRNINDITYVGLFANNYGIIKNLNLKNMVSNSSGENGVYYFIGGISGNNKGTIINCTVDGNFETEGNYALISGISGRNEGNIELCTNYSKIFGKSMYIAGIVAQNLAQVKKCANFGEINSQKFGRYIGGITGLTMADDSSVKESFNGGNINVSKSDSYTTHTGGVAGQAMSNISNSYNKGNIFANISLENIESRLGGICGDTSSELNNCYSYGRIEINRSSTDNQVFLGGITGILANNYIKNVYSSMEFKLNKLDSSVNIGNVIGKIQEGAHVGGTSDLYFYGENEAIGNNLSDFDINCIKFDKKPAQVEILNIINANDNKFVEDTVNSNDGYPLLNWEDR